MEPGAYDRFNYGRVSHAEQVELDRRNNAEKQKFNVLRENFPQFVIDKELEDSALAKKALYVSAASLTGALIAFGYYLFGPSKDKPTAIGFLALGVSGCVYTLVMAFMYYRGIHGFGFLFLIIIILGIALIFALWYMTKESSKSSFIPAVLGVLGGTIVAGGLYAYVINFESDSAAYAAYKDSVFGLKSHKETMQMARDNFADPERAPRETGSILGQSL